MRILRPVKRQGQRTLVFVEQFYFPEGWGGAQLPRDITTDLARRGWTVDVVCGSDQYTPVTDHTEQNPERFGVRIRRIPRILVGSIHQKKWLRQLWFYLLAFPYLAVVGRPELFVTQTNPPFVVPIVALVAGLRRREFVIVAQDIYPEVLFANGTCSPTSWIGRLLSNCFGWAYRRASAVVSLGPTMSRRLHEKAVAPERVAEIPNWATGEVAAVRGAANSLRDAWNLAGRFVVLYSGNIGLAHDIRTPIEAVHQASKINPSILLVFVGKGSRLEEARRLVEVMGLRDNVRFYDPVPIALLPHSLGLANIALVTLRSGFEGLVVPSKTLGYLARGIPILYVGPDSDIHSLLATSGGGICFPNGEAEEIAAALLSLAASEVILDSLGRNGHLYYHQFLTKDRALARYCALFERVAGTH